MSDIDKKHGTQEPVCISFTRNEAIVLFDFISRLNKCEHRTLFDVQAEQQVLWNLECILEKELVEPFWDNYKEV